MVSHHRPANNEAYTTSYTVCSLGRKFLDPELNEVRVVFLRQGIPMRTRLLTVAKRRLGSIGAARGVCSHPGRAARHESPEGELRRLAGYDQTSVSLKVTLDTGLGLLLRADDHLDDGVTRRERTLMQIASFLKRELPVRLARRVLELRALPEELDQMPSVRRVHDWCARRMAPPCPRSCCLA